MGVAAAAGSTALGMVLNWLAGVPMIVIPLYIIGVMLLISTPSMILAALKLRQRNLGPILDANGWAVNAKAKINIPFGGSLTHVPKLPPGSHRDLSDAFAERHPIRNWFITIAIVLIALGLCWYFGLTEKVMPNVFRKSPYVQRVEEQQQKDAEAQKKKDDAKKAAETQAAADTAPATTTAPK